MKTWESLCIVLFKLINRNSMPYTINISHLFPTATYAVEDVLTLKIGEQEYNTTLTYKIFVKTEKKPTYDVVIERSQFLVNGEEIDTKFLSISHKYMEAIFPLKFKVKDYVLKIQQDAIS